MVAFAVEAAAIRLNDNHEPGSAEEPFIYQRRLVGSKGPAVPLCSSPQ
jgi:hypothetical protein